METLWELVKEQGLLIHIVRPVVGVLARNGGDHEQCEERETDHCAFLLKHDACLLKPGGASARR